MSKYQPTIATAANTTTANTEDDDGTSDDEGFATLISNKQYLNGNQNDCVDEYTSIANNYMPKILRSMSTNSIAGNGLDDSVIEVPLLNASHRSHASALDINDLQESHELTHCQCNQRGFGANLTSKSTRDARCRILLAIALCCVFMCVEFLGGYLAGSLAIMSDAAHLATDCISFIIGLVSIWLGSRVPDTKMSFGYKRLEVMGAIVSILGIWLLTATLFLVAIERIYAGDYNLDANTMMTVSAIGILINIAMAFILHGSTSLLPKGISAHGHSHAHAHAHSHSHAHNHERMQSSATSLTTLQQTDFLLQADVDGSTTLAIGNGSTKQTKNCEFDDFDKKNVNLRAAMIHVIGDLVQSFGVFVAAVLIKFFPNAKVADPLCTILFSFIVILTTIRLFNESVGVLLDAVPQDINLTELKCDLKSITGVKSLHHLNVWNHTSDFPVLMVHLVLDNNVDATNVLEKATKLTKSSKYNIQHATIQIEFFKAD